MDRGCTWRENVRSMCFSYPLCLISIFPIEQTRPILIRSRDLLSWHDLFRYNPVGDTDSEAIFCSILNALKAKFDVLPSLPVLHVTLQQLCKEIESDDDSILNFLLGCGEHVQFAYSLPGARPGSDVWNGLHYTIREPPFTQAHLSDCDYAVDFSEFCTDEDRVAVIATKPLTEDEEWIELGKGQLVLFDNGLPYAEPDDCFEVELQGHGLDSDVVPPNPSLEEDLRRYQFQQSFFAGSDI
mmetsp:Transcript_54108/g.161966  ORF Transcript_54108/g.161966 Transcript_54108/m.161966 type:complete len:241 (+) Transcript_54108:99-821(+)